MRQIINIQVGQCGNRIGNTFWRQAIQQHQIGINQQKKLMDKQINHEFPQVYFTQMKNGHYFSKSILTDLDSNTLDNISASDMRSFFRQQNIISSDTGSGNLYARALFTKGPQIIENVIDSVRRQAENCQSIQGFHFLHGISGGTGSGFGSLILQKLNNQYPKQIVQNATILPSIKKNSDCTIQMYNSAFTLSRLIQYSQQTLFFDNLALQTLCNKQNKNIKYTFKDYNKLIAQSMLGVTAGSRFSGQLTSNLRKISINLVPFPRWHFFMLSHQKSQSRLYPQKQLIRQSMHKSSIMCSVDIESGRNYAVSANFMSKFPICTSAIQDNLLKLRDFNSSRYVQWIPNNFVSSYSTNPRIKQNMESTFVINNNSVSKIFSDIVQKFGKMFRRKSYVHWYTIEGMDQMQFTQTQSNLHDLISQHPYQGEYCESFEHSFENDRISVQ